LQRGDDNGHDVGVCGVAVSAFFFAGGEEICF